MIEEMNREEVVDYILDMPEEELKELKGTHNARSDFELIEIMQRDLNFFKNAKKQLRAINNEMIKNE